MHDTKLRRSTHLCIVVSKESFIDLLSLIHPSFVCYTANFSSTMIRYTAAPSAHPFDVTIDLSSQERDSTLINSSQTRRQSNPRHSRRSDRRGTMGSPSSNSTGGGAISVESSEDAFASDLMALADQAEVNTASTINVPAENNASIFLDRQLSSLTIDDGSTNSEGTNGEPLLIRKVQSQLLDKHIRSGRIFTRWTQSRSACQFCRRSAPHSHHPFLRYQHWPSRLRDPGQFDAPGYEP